MAIKVYPVLSDPDISSMSKITVSEANGIENTVMTIITCKNRTLINMEHYRDKTIEIKGKTHSSVVEETLLRLRDMKIDLFETFHRKMFIYNLKERIARREEDIRVAREREQTTRERLGSMLDVNDGNFVKASVAKEVAEAKVEAAAIKGQEMGVQVKIEIRPNLDLDNFDYIADKVGREYLAILVLEHADGSRYPYFLCLVYKSPDAEEWSLRGLRDWHYPGLFGIESDTWCFDPEHDLFKTFSLFDESFMKGRIEIERDSRVSIVDRIRDALISKALWYPVSSAEDYNLYVDLDRCEQNYRMLAMEHDRYQEHLGILSHTIRTSTRIMEMDKRELEYIEKYVKYQQEEATHAAEDEG